jgi:hypothetical protein
VIGTVYDIRERNPFRASKQELPVQFSPILNINKILMVSTLISGDRRNGYADGLTMLPLYDV